MIRKAEYADLEAVYLMGFDVWGDGLSRGDYLLNCRNSSKYKLGTWYLLEKERKPVASLIVYSGHFGLAENCYGIGSVATSPEERGKGFASFLIQAVTEELLYRDNGEVVFLHSDIGIEFYQKLGYVLIPPSNCLYRKSTQVKYDGPVPEYF